MSKNSRQTDNTSANNKRAKNYRSNNKKRVGGGTPRDGGKYTSTNDSSDYRDNQCNDPAWYIPTDQNLSDVATFSFNHPAGYRSGAHSRYVNASQTTGFYSVDTKETVPGVASLRLMPTIGTSSDETSAVNIAAMNMYSAIRRANSGAKNYDAPDLMQVVLAVGQVYSCISWLMRLYGYTNVYSSQNAYVPRALVEANGVNWASLANNQNDFRARINQLVLQINAINVPKGLPIFDRWFHIYEKCYSDSNTPQAQIYQTVPEGFLYRSDETGTLTFTRLPFYEDGELMDYETIIIYANQMINSLLYSEDVGTISGDVLKAFGDGGIYRLPIIPEDYSVIPTLSDEIRSQYENAVIIPLDFENSSYVISQDVDRAFLVSKFKATCKNAYVAPAGPKALNFHKADITPADVIVATRWIPGIDGSTIAEDTSRFTISFTSYGSEIAVGLIITTTATKTDGTLVFFHTPVASGLNLAHPDSSVSTSNTYYLAAVASQISAFDWFPEVCIFAQSTPAPGNDSYDDSLQFMGSLLDWDRYYILQLNNINDLNTTAILGLFGVPNL